MRGTFKDTNGISQGSPLSMLPLNILMAVPSSVLTPVVRNESFADDLTPLSSSALDLHRTADLMSEFMIDKGQKGQGQEDILLRTPRRGGCALQWTSNSQEDSGEGTWRRVEVCSWTFTPYGRCRESCGRDSQGEQDQVFPASLLDSQR